ncbi:hypothetical protein Clacol_003561 [Clathrus columnatus]|uniref:DUF159-domain-containing protein n=1 Tax=Clathrus columnatus TaxID=1419009 RepID=A0AAV5A9C3_9AGAM|nr:hypothetical protein Clacol_003561 [Clathrus columnatus]
MRNTLLATTSNPSFKWGSVVSLYKSKTFHVTLVEGLQHVRVRRVFQQQQGDLEWIDEDAFQPRYNVAPRSNAPVVRRHETNDSNDSPLVLHTMKWGVVPHWSKHEQSSLNTINARAENLIESGGMWSSMKAKKRCVVVCDGYFEWLKKGKDRLPHFIRRKDEDLMLLAGLYDCATLEDSSTPLWTFTIVTTDASPDISWLHDRQPVILSSPEQVTQWLDTKKGWHTDLFDLFKAGNSDSNLECYQVPKEVGRVGTNSPDLIKPISQRKDGIETMFSRQKQKKNLDLSEEKFECSPKLHDDSPPDDDKLHPRKKRKIQTTEDSPPSNKASKVIISSPSTPKGKRKASSIEKSPTQVLLSILILKF